MEDAGQMFSGSGHVWFRRLFQPVQKGCCHNLPGESYILLPSCGNHLEIHLEIPVFLEGCPVPLTSLLPAFTISGARQCLQPAAWDQVATSSSGEEGKLCHSRGTAVQDCLSDCSVQSLDNSPAIP